MGGFLQKETVKERHGLSWRVDWCKALSSGFLNEYSVCAVYENSKVGRCLLNPPRLTPLALRDSQRLSVFQRLRERERER